MDHYKNVSTAVVKISSMDGWIRIEPGETGEVDPKRLEKDGGGKTDVQKYVAIKWIRKVKAPADHPPPEEMSEEMEVPPDEAAEEE